MKRLSICLLFFVATVSLFADSSVAWEGRAAVGSSDIFPSGGNYAQSRVFSKGEIVDVYNTSNGKTTSVVITGSTELSGVLILLSPSAAGNLDISGGYDSVVRISRKNDYVQEGTLAGNSVQSAQDPDTNPVAALKDDLVYTETNKPSDYVEPITETPSQYVAQAETVQPVQTVPQTQTVVQQPVQTAPQTQTATTPVFVNPQQPVQTVPQTQTAVQQQPAQTVPQSQYIQPVPQSQYVQPQQNQTASAYEYSLLPTAPVVEKDPVYVQPPKRTESVSSAKTSSMPYPELLINDYKVGKFYVQLAVYRDMKNLVNVVSKYRGKYPISIKSSEMKTGGYELLVGPLSQDEYKTVLEKFRKDGFVDAFVKFKK